LYLLVQCIQGRRRPDRLGHFALGALLPTLLLLGYNQLAFGSPWTTGYQNEVLPDFARVHNLKNPFGLRAPDWTKLGPLLWRSHRGLFFYAPVLLGTVPGWVVLLWSRRGSAAIVSILAVVSVLLVNLCYPEWTGGWSTGPRLLVPLIPFAMIGVAGLMAGGSRAARFATLVLAGLAFLGGFEMLLFQGVGGRIPQFELDPFGVVCSLWKGGTLPRWCEGHRFCCNLVSQAAPEGIPRLAPQWQFLQFLPLVLAQGLAILALWRFGTVETGSEPANRSTV
jgi:hypothetical protein